MSRLTSGDTARCINCDRPIIFRTSILLPGEKHTRREVWLHHQDSKVDCPQGTKPSTFYRYSFRSNPTAAPAGLCLETVDSRWSIQTCYRKVNPKYEEWNMCGIHGSVRARMEERERQRKAHYELDALIVEGVEAQIKQLEALGVGAVAYSRWDRNNNVYVTTGKVVVDPEQLLEILNEERF